MGQKMNLLDPLLIFSLGIVGGFIIHRIINEVLYKYWKKID